MSRREKLCLQLRNRNGQENETYCRHYLKSKGIYLRFAFFKFQSVSVFLMCAIFTVTSIFMSDDDSFARYISLALAVIPGLFWLCSIYKALWYWKYTKHVFVTDEGIWVMACSMFWWRGAPDFTGKRRLLAPSWSLYSWSSLKKISFDYQSNAQNVSKILGFFENFDKVVKKSSKFKSVYLTRWDGVEEIEFLKNADAEEIVSYARSQKRSKKKKAEQEE